MAQVDQHIHWVIAENIARFQEQLKFETDICRRKLLEGLLVLECERLRMVSSPSRNSSDAAAGKAPEHDQAEGTQTDVAPEGR